MSWSFYNAAGFLKTNTGRELVSTLPSSPVDGQEVFYQSAGMSTDGAVWHLRYDAASVSSHKWEFVGGSNLSFFDNANVGASLTQNTWSDISTAQKITVPLAGDYNCSWSVQTYLSSGTQGIHVGLRVDTTEPIVDTNTTYSSNAALVWYSHNQMRRITGIGASKDITIRFRNGGATATYNRYACSMFVTPVRLG